MFSDLLIMGDFNAPNVDWNDYTCSDGISSFCYKLINATLDSYLTQHVLYPTRHIPGQRSSILDLVFTSNPNSIESMQHLSPLGSSDHECLLFKLKYFTKQSTPKDVMSKYNYMKADYPTISSELSKVHWDTLLNEQSIDANWNTFKSVVLAISSKYIPKVNKKCVSNKPPLWSTQISKAVRDKQHLFSQYKYTRSVADYASCAVKRNQVKSMISSAKARHDKILIQNLTTNPKALYGYVRDKNKVKTSIGQLEKLDGSLTNGEKEVVEVLNDFFQSVFTKEDPSSIPGFHLELVAQWMRFILLKWKFMISYLP